MIKSTTLTVSLAVIYELAQSRNLAMPDFKPGSDLGEIINLSGDQSGVYTPYDDQVSVGCEERECTTGHFDF